MSRRALLFALVVGLVRVPSGAQNAPAPAASPDPAEQMRTDTARLRSMQQRPSDADLAATATYVSERAAAAAFVDLVRKYPEQRMEYCAYILRGADKRYSLGPIRQGDMNQCPSDRPKPANAVAITHTHPLWGRSSDVSAAGQMFSEADFAFAESAEMNMPIYLGAPAGHILRYAPGGTFCRGTSFVRRNFEIVRDISPSVVGRLPIDSGADVPLYSESGQKLPRPSYCQQL